MAGFVHNALHSRSSSSSSSSPSSSSARLIPSSSNFRYVPVAVHDENDNDIDTMKDDEVTSASPGGDTETAKPTLETIEHASPSGHNHRLDAAAELLRKTQDADGGARIIVTAEDSRHVLRRIDMVILPIMLTVYFLQGLDKATLAYASVFGLIEDTGLDPNSEEYSWLGSIVYLAQLIMQPLLAWLLVKLPIGKFTSVMVLCWGATLSCMAAAHNFGGLVTTRFFLGAFEAGVAPSFVAITQMWWRRREQTVRVSYWYAMNGVTNMVGLTAHLSWKTLRANVVTVWQSHYLRVRSHLFQPKAIPGMQARPSYNLEFYGLTMLDHLSLLRCDHRRLLVCHVCIHARLAG